MCQEHRINKVVIFASIFNLRGSCVEKQNYALFNTYLEQDECYGRGAEAMGGANAALVHWNQLL